MVFVKKFFVHVTDVVCRRALDPLFVWSTLMLVMAVSTLLA
ncbi:hypothetical protein D3OALGA1CA_1084 [Olavius algarvensis associated proteobacterium Delta 3]|nr:hypothetical protein D3OALGA1CA_1084 [Olavius algarvensis associated proteobacterium Delta 3]